MTKLTVGGENLGRIHRKSNDKKYFCYFTGFLEGIAASGMLEKGEVEPLIAQCEEFAKNVSDPDAIDLVQDFKIDVLEHATILDAVEFRVRDIDSTCLKSSLNRLYGYFAGVACDDYITVDEAKGIVNFVGTNDEFLKDPLIAAVVYTCNDAIFDGVIDAQESADICLHISRLVGDCYADTGLSAMGNVPVFTSGTLSNEDDLSGLVFILSGAFAISPRSKIEDKIRELGGDISKTLNKKTDYLVIASAASRDWVTTHRGNKIIKAEEHRAKFGTPTYLSEYNLMKVLGPIV